MYKNSEKEAKMEKRAWFQAIIDYYYGELAAFYSDINGTSLAY